MDKSFVKGVLACLAVIVLMGAGRKYIHSQRVHMNEGNTAAGFSVTCSDSAWTAVVAANANRRSVVVQSLATNTFNVCIATSTAGPCVDGMVGFELTPGSTLDESSEVALNCRARSGGSEVLKGIEYDDSKD